jgi:hypothetical protein
MQSYEKKLVKAKRFWKLFLQVSFQTVGHGGEGELGGEGEDD